MKRLETLLLVIISLTGLLVLCSCTGQNVSLSSEPKTFSKYGFSFEYPGNFILTETGTIEGDNSYQEGSLIVRTRADCVNSLGIIWLDAELDEEPYSTLENRIDLFVTEPDLKEVSNWNEDNSLGYRLIYRTFSAKTESGYILRGVAGGLYSENSQRFFVFYYTNSNVTNSESTVANLIDYLRTFNCE